MTQDHAAIDRLLHNLRGGDPQALAELFMLYRDRLGRMVRVRLDHRLSSRVSPSDVLQEAYLDALQRLPHYLDKPHMSFFAWLRWVVRQRLVDLHRQHLGAQKRDAGQEVSLNADDLSGAGAVGVAAQLIGRLSSPSQAALRGELLAQVEAALDRLDPVDREVLVLRHLEELSNGEVAEVLGLHKAAASKRYVRALTRLREALASLPGFLDDAP